MSQMKRLYEKIICCPECGNIPVPEANPMGYSMACECHDPTPMHSGDPMIDPPHFGAGETLTEAIDNWNDSIKEDVFGAINE